MILFSHKHIFVVMEGLCFRYINVGLSRVIGVKNTSIPPDQEIMYFIIISLCSGKYRLKKRKRYADRLTLAIWALLVTRLYIKLPQRLGTYTPFI